MDGEQVAGFGVHEFETVTQSPSTGCPYGSEQTLVFVCCIEPEKFCGHTRFWLSVFSWQVAGAGWQDRLISNHPESTGSPYGSEQFCSLLYVTAPIWLFPQLCLSSVTTL